MANNQLIQAPSSIKETNKLDSFTLFPKLPAELRIKIWKLSFVPRRIVMNKTLHCWQDDQTLPGAHLLVNFEARQVFLENYTLWSLDPVQATESVLDQKPVYINFSIDSLCVMKALKGLQELIRQYPGVMSQFQWINVGRDRNTWRKRDTLSLDWSRMDLSALASCKKITVGWNMDTNNPWDYHGMWHDGDMERTFGNLKKSLSRSPGPKLAVVYPSYPSWPVVQNGRARSYNVYAEISQDLTLGSFGTYKTDNLLGELDVEWIQRDQPWAAIEPALSSFKRAREPEPGIYNDPPPMEMQQVTAPMVTNRGVGWIEYIFGCFL